MGGALCSGAGDHAQPDRTASRDDNDVFEPIAARSTACSAHDRGSANAA